MKENEATIFLLDLLREQYQLNERTIKKHYNVIKKEKTARIIILLILQTKINFLGYPNLDKLITEVIKEIFFILKKNPDYDYEEIFNSITFNMLLFENL